MTKYTKTNNKFEYVCPYCGYLHKIDNDFFVWNELNKGKEVQDRCFRCNKILELEPRKILYKLPSNKKEYATSTARKYFKYALDYVTENKTNSCMVNRIKFEFDFNKLIVYINEYKHTLIKSEA